MMTALKHDLPHHSARIGDGIRRFFSGGYFECFMGGKEGHPDQPIEPIGDPEVGRVAGPFNGIPGGMGGGNRGRYFTPILRNIGKEIYRQKRGDGGGQRDGGNQRDNAQTQRRPKVWQVPESPASKWPSPVEGPPSRRPWGPKRLTAAQQCPPQASAPVKIANNCQRSALGELPVFVLRYATAGHSTSHVNVSITCT